MTRHARLQWIATASLWAGLLAGGPALSQTAAPSPAPEGSGLRFNGFGSIGVTHTMAPAPWGFRRDISQPANDGGTRADIDTRLGLQLNYTASTQLEFVGQVLLKRRVGASPPIDSLEWAFASYRPTPDWTLRVGRTNPDAFLLSDYRNVGFAYLWARPEIGFYGALSVYSIDGADVSRTWSLGGARWKAKLFSGAGAGYGVSMQGQPATKLLARNLTGLTLSREADGLNLRATAIHMRVALDQIDAVRQLGGALDGLQRLPLPELAAEARRLQRGLAIDAGELTFLEWGASYEGAEWLMSAELSHIDGSFAAYHGVAGYASLGRRFGALTVYGVLAASRSSGDAKAVPSWGNALAPVLGPALAQQAQQLGAAAAFTNNAQRQRQRSASLGLRWDFHPQMALKLQWDHYRIDSDGHLLWSNATSDAATANVGTAVLDFVF